MNKIKLLTDVDFDGATKQGIVIVDFFSPTCGPCKNVEAMLESVADELKAHKAVVIYKVDVYQSGSTAARFGVRALPTLIIMKDGQPKMQRTGMIDKTSIYKAIAEAL